VKKKLIVRLDSNGMPDYKDIEFRFPRYYTILEFRRMDNNYTILGNNFIKKPILIHGSAMICNYANSEENVYRDNVKRLFNL